MNGRLGSAIKNIQDSYVKIPANQSEHIYFDNTKIEQLNILILYYLN